MDPLSDVLSLLRPHSFMFRGLDAGGAWALRYPANEGLRCYAVLSGQCWLDLEDGADPVRLTAGDCVLLTRRQSFRLASDTRLTPVDAVALFSAAREGGVAIHQGGGDCTGIGGYFGFAGKEAGMLLGLLPAVVHIRREADKATLRSSIELLMQELREPQPGGYLFAQHLAHMMLVLALRLHLAQGPAGETGWLFALADRQLGAAISAMHGAPAQRWTLPALAQRACMSRSSFALKFKETVGASPMEYLVRWRMLLAGDRLTHSGDSISVVGQSLGYASDSAFSTAFRRVMGCSPRQYASSRKPAAAASSGRRKTARGPQLEATADSESTHGPR